MPIYAYRCSTCGHAKDVLQKMSDPVLTVCPDCGASTFVKQVTAAGFQLKGSGWYVTDFRGGNKSAPAAEKDAPAKPDANGESANSGGKSGGDGKGDSAPADSSPSTAKSDAAPAAAPAPAPAPPSSGSK